MLGVKKVYKCEFEIYEKVVKKMFKKDVLENIEVCLNQICLFLLFGWISDVNKLLVKVVSDNFDNMMVCQLVDIKIIE